MCSRPKQQGRSEQRQPDAAGAQPQRLGQVAAENQFLGGGLQRQKQQRHRQVRPEAGRVEAEAVEAGIEQILRQIDQRGEQQPRPAGEQQPAASGRVPPG